MYPADLSIVPARQIGEKFHLQSWCSLPTSNYLIVPNFLHFAKNNEKKILDNSFETGRTLWIDKEIKIHLNNLAFGKRLVGLSFEKFDEQSGVEGEE
jgi:hypothetical protein